MDVRAAAPRAEQAVEAARAALAHDGVHLMPAAVTTSSLGMTTADWDHFRRHWDELSPDIYAGARGTCRLRRYGQFSLTDPAGRIGLLPQGSFVQPENSNPLYVGVDRTFEPLTDAFVADPVFGAVLRLLARLATALDKPSKWSAKVHPFRVVASADTNGLPTPEGRHRDGVTLVSSLLVGRQNAVGGASAVFDPNERQLLRTTLGTPGALLLGDDRRTLHSVSPVHPMDPSRPAYRDVLVVTFAPG
ncbi:2OG-Fe dioxygenase family protein [Nocardia abscessus]|uniref:2OG-Fe dioxygenase family protein n=1 Tax=Nocardia abscessus TaxID=120957 RepID=UPI001895A924|nr:2OG-Fe dioxygenase family protein [Nocardia abscessus]MBF6336758.1 2OG-Fe dioxygenase family protein [Nocardia abscessus]